ASAASLEVAGVQVDAIGDLAPDNLSQTGRREFRHLLRSHNLELTALACPMRRGLDVAEKLEVRIEHVRKVMIQSADLGPRRVIVEAGRITGETEPDANVLLSQSLLAL